MGYARVSTSDQDMRMQRDALIGAGVDPRDVFEETASGASMAKRREFQAMMKDVRAGDIVYVWKLDRLARNAMDLHITASAIEKKGARLVVLTMPGMDTGTPVGKAMFGMLAVFAEFERAISNERTIAGLRAARERGRVGGRVSKYTDEQVLALHNLMPAEGAKTLGMKSAAGFKKRLAKALENAAKGTPNARG
jgi:DNA invertase Pin-like site-specific DNA recombinase